MYKFTGKKKKHDSESVNPRLHKRMLIISNDAMFIYD